ncbi:hypothetical protein H4R35_003605 [Dimargaris xerosporica]|nr:hypothetical protein H4R35_003605 [Dimargaris xerosporica]
MHFVTTLLSSALCTLALASLAHARHDFKRDESHFGEDDSHMVAYVKKVLGKDAPADLDHFTAHAYYFSWHDTNDDGQLDGFELRNTWFEHLKNTESAAPSLFKVTEIVDDVLVQDDLDNNGMVSFEEYLASQSKQHQF